MLCGDLDGFISSYLRMNDNDNNNNNNNNNSEEVIIYMVYEFQINYTIISCIGGMIKGIMYCSIIKTFNRADRIIG